MTEKTPIEVLRAISTPGTYLLTEEERETVVECHLLMLDHIIDTARRFNGSGFQASEWARDVILALAREVAALETRTGGTVP